MSTAEKILSCALCGHVPELLPEKDDPKMFKMQGGANCRLCRLFERYRILSMSKDKWLAVNWNPVMPFYARVLALADADRFAPTPMKCGCGAMTRGIRDGLDYVEYVLQRRLDLWRKPEIAKLATLDDADLVTALVEDYGGLVCTILGGDCPRYPEDDAAENMKCCLPEYAAKKPAEKLDDETLAAIAGMTGCLECDALGKHWYLSECDRCDCDGVDAHLKCYYLAAEYRKRMKSRKKSAK